MSIEVIFRPMQLSDVEDVHALETSIFPTPWSAKSYRFEVQHNHASDPWVALIRNANSYDLIGYVVSWILINELHIANIAVHPDFRKQGIGKQMLAGALERAKANGLSSVTLEVRSSNKSAQSLYRAFGFKEIGMRKQYYKNNREDALIMHLESLEKVPIQSFVEVQ